MGQFHFVASEKTAELLNRFLLDPSTVSKTEAKPYALELASLPVYQAIFKDHGQTFDILPVSQFLKEHSAKDVYLIFDGTIESFLYSKEWEGTLPVDGAEVILLMGDKYATYKLLNGVSMRQPKTVALRGQSDFFAGLEQITTDRVVIKPRFFTYESKNVLLVDRQRFLNPASEERFNFSDMLLQEYLEDTLWPPEEWRFHFVGRELCRTIHIVDKNNWTRAFSLENVPVGETPPAFRAEAEKAAKALVKEGNKDNFTLDFLCGKDGLIFLEANVGNLNSFYVHSPEERAFIEPIFAALFRFLA